MEDENSQDYSITVGPGLEIAQVMEILRLSDEGKGEKEIQKTTGVPIKVVRQALAFQRIQALEGYVITNPKLVSEIVKAQMLKDMVEADAPRDRAGAAKILISDPALGFTQDTVRIKIELTEQLQKLDPGKFDWEEGEEE